MGIRMELIQGKLMPEEIKPDPEWTQEVKTTVDQLLKEYPAATLDKDLWEMENGEDDEQIVVRIIKFEYPDWLDVCFGLNSSKCSISCSFSIEFGESCPCNYVEITAHYPNGPLFTMIKANVEMFLEMHRKAKEELEKYSE